MKITEGQKQTRPVANFFDEEITTTSRELLFDGKRYSELNDDGKHRAISATEKRHRDRMGSWAFLTGLGAFCFLLAVHLTAFGIIFVIALTALICWAMVSKF